MRVGRLCRGVFTGFPGSSWVRDESCNHAGSVFEMGFSVYSLGCNLLGDAWDAGPGSMRFGV